MAEPGREQVAAPVVAADAEAVVASGAEGVGLFRTEYLFVQRDTLPSEDEQFEAYRRVALGMDGKPVVIRTLDLGADKMRTETTPEEERNPCLGLRSIRLSLRQLPMFRTQLRAILRASARSASRGCATSSGPQCTNGTTKSARVRAAAMSARIVASTPTPTATAHAMASTRRRCCASGSRRRPPGGSGSGGSRSSSP